MKLDIVAFPRDPNPYQELLYDEMRRSGVRVRYAGELTRSRSLNLLLLPLELMVRRRRGRGATVFHLHWMFGFVFPAPVPRRFGRFWFQIVLGVIVSCRYRLVWTAHNVLPHERVFDDDLLARRRLVQKASLVIAHSSESLNGLRAIGAAPSRAVVIPHGPMAAAGLSGLGPPVGHSPRTVLFIGRIASYKGVEDLLEALGGLSADIRVVIAGACGEKRLRVRLERMARTMPDKVELRLGFVPDNELVALLDASDAIAYPFREITTSGSVMLGLTAGRPIIIPDLAALEFVPEGAAIRFEPGVQGLRDALDRFARTATSELEQMGACARRSAAPVSWSQIATMTHQAMLTGQLNASRTSGPPESSHGVTAARLTTSTVAPDRSVPTTAVDAEAVESEPESSTSGSTMDGPAYQAAVGPVADADGLFRRVFAVIRADALTRSSSLLVLSYLVVGLVGGVCTVIAARSWSPHSVGAVAAITGVVTLLGTATSSGAASTITRFLGEEHNQLSFVAEAVLLVSVLGIAVSALVCFVPGHFGVPIHDVFGSDVAAFAFMGGYVVFSNVVSVTDPAFVARKEVSYSVVKDLTAAILRVGILVALIGSGVQWLFGAALIYTAIAALMDVGLIRWRLRDTVTTPPAYALRLVRRRLRFVTGSHSAALVASLPATLLPVIVAAALGPRQAAFVGIPLLILTFVTVIPFMTAQALLTELSGPADRVPSTSARGLRIAYLGTLPVATILIVFAPEILLVFGPAYSSHATEFLRWIAASTLFSTFNYIGDTVLLARQRMLAYNVVNVLGTVAVLGSIAVGVSVGFSWIGPAMVVGQFLYSSMLVTAILRHGALSDAIRAITTLRWSLT